MITLNALSITFIALFTIQWLTVVYLEIINVRHIRENGREVPKGFDGYIDAGKLKKIASYAIENSRFGLIGKTVPDAVLLAIVLTGALGAIDAAATALGSHYFVSGPIFVAILITLFSIIDLPFGYYDTFVLEEKYGFNRTTLRLWLLDHLKSWVLTIVLTTALIIPVLWTIQAFPKYWWLYGFIVVMIFELCVTLLYPVLIAPLFNTFEPLKDEELAQKVKDIMRSANLKPGRILQMDAGTRSSHSNAYFTGFGKTKRIVLFDTLLETHSQDEIIAVLAHEIGHYKGRHIIKSVGLSAVMLLAGFYLTYHVMNWSLFTDTFGPASEKPYAALFIIGVFWQKAGYFLKPLGMALSRHFERQADTYSILLTKSKAPMASALKELASHNLANLTPHPFYVWFNYSHPPLVERVRRIEAHA